ncbi:MAG: hypothetical protein ABIH38_02275 [Patescibacteria group bacterium]
MFINKKIFITIAAIIVVIVVLVTIFVLRPVSVFHPSMSGSSGVMFKLIDGDISQPISNHKITICDDLIKYDWVRITYEGFCNYQKVWGYVTTDQEGRFSLNVKSINITPPTAIMIDPGKDYYAINISRSGTITNNHSSSSLRVMNQEKSGHVISNLFYNFDTKEVKEVFTNGDPEKTYSFDLINLIVFKIK